MGYTCSNCKESDVKPGVKLWRHRRDEKGLQLLCFKCAKEDQGVKIAKLKRDGTHKSAHGFTDQIGSGGELIPAIPILYTRKDEGYSYYAVNDFPSKPYTWWQRLPSE